MIAVYRSWTHFKHLQNWIQFFHWIQIQFFQHWIQLFHHKQDTYLHISQQPWVLWYGKKFISSCFGFRNFFLPPRFTTWACLRFLHSNQNCLTFGLHCYHWSKLETFKWSNLQQLGNFEKLAISVILTKNNSHLNVSK